MFMSLLKYLSQIFLVAGGVMSLWWDSHKITPEGKKRPTLLGWFTIAALVTGLILFVVTDLNERKESKKKEAAQLEQVTYLKEIYFNRIISEVEISFKPTPEHRLRIVEAYNNTKRLYTTIPYADVPMIAERAGDYWKVRFESIVRPEAQYQFEAVDTSKPTGRGFESVIRQATINLRIQWGDSVTTVIRPIGGDGYPPVVAVSQDRIAYTLRPPLNLSVLREKPTIMMRGENYPNSIRIRSLDPTVVFDETFDLNWTQQDDKSIEARMMPYISGPHHLKIKFKTDPGAAHS